MAPRDLGGIAHIDREPAPSVAGGNQRLPLALAASERPVGPLAFAGEHLGGPFAALMEGAIRSGRAAARALHPG